MKNQINLIVRRLPNHAGPSGYDQLTKFIMADKIISPIEEWRFHQRVVCRIFKGMINRSQSLWYQRDSFYQELTAASLCFKGGKQVFHFLYGENCYRYLGIFKALSHGSKIIATYHTPKNKFDLVVKDREHLKKLDAVIVVSMAQVDFIAEIIGSNKVHYIPHGIDTKFYKKKSNKRNPNELIRCVFVGTHLRDFEALASAAKILNEKSIKFELAVVTFKKFHSIFDGIENIVCLDKISDESLLSLYQNSHLLVLPLLDSTANNTLLEAMACGLPIIATDLIGVRDYINESCAILTPARDSLAIADSVIFLQKRYDMLCHMANESRKRAEEFSWQNVAYKIENIYKNLLQ